MKTSVQAVYFAQSIDLKRYRSKFPLKGPGVKRGSLAYHSNTGEYLFLFSFGVAVFYGYSEKKIDETLATLKEYGEGILKNPFWDEYSISIGSHKQTVDFDCIYLKAAKYEPLAVIARAMANTVALDYFDDVLNEYLKETDGINRELEARGKFSSKEKDILKLIGACNQVRQQIATDLWLLDRPESVWEDEALETLWDELSEMLDLEMRFAAVTHKYEVLRENFSVVLEVIHSRTGHRLEWIIIILIAVEIMIYVFELLHGL